MTKIFSFIFFTLLGLNLLGQKDTVFIKYDLDDIPDKMHYKTDTVFFETPMRRHILKGTTVLPWTHNQQIAKNFGLSFDKVSQSDCKKQVTEFSPKELPNQFNSIINTDSELIIDINISDNCCYSFLCDIAVVNGSTINLIYYGYGTYCDCDCCFGLTYKLSKDAIYPDLKKITSVIINGNTKTLKQIKKTN